MFILKTNLKSIALLNAFFLFHLRWKFQLWQGLKLFLNIQIFVSLCFFSFFYKFYGGPIFLFSEYQGNFENLLLSPKANFYMDVILDPYIEVLSKLHILLCSWFVLASTYVFLVLDLKWHSILLGLTSYYSS